MINLKQALLATGAAGAITAGGTAAYAIVGNNTPASTAKPVADSAKKVVDSTTGGIPASAPTCLSLPKGKLSKPELPKGKLPEGKLPSAPVTLPTDKVKAPANLPTDKVKAPANLPTDKAKVPANLPTCAPGTVPSTKPTVQSAGAPAAKPGLPNVKAPAVKLPDCSSVPPAIKLEKAQAKDITLPTGLHLTYAHAHSIMIQSQKICTNVEKFTAAGGKYLTAERLQTPPQITLKELAAELKLPQGDVISASGGQMWQSPLGTAMLWISDKGYAISLTGSPEYAGQLPAIATGLQHIQ